MDLNIQNNRAFFLDYLSISDLDPVWEECPGAEGAGDQLLHVRLPDGAEAVTKALLLWKNVDKKSLNNIQGENT